MSVTSVMPCNRHIIPTPTDILLNDLVYGVFIDLPDMTEIVLKVITDLTDNVLYGITDVSDFVKHELKGSVEV